MTKLAILTDLQIINLIQLFENDSINNNKIEIRFNINIRINVCIFII